MTIETVPWPKVEYVADVFPAAVLVAHGNPPHSSQIGGVGGSGAHLACDPIPPAVLYGASHAGVGLGPLGPAGGAIMADY